MAERTGHVLGLSPDRVLVCSTGVIGPRVPLELVDAGLPKAAADLRDDGGEDFARAILTTDNRHLRFVAPRKFTDLGTIPVSKRDSIAVTVLGRKAGEAMNNVPMIKHVSFFESVKIRDRVVPIQKMVTVPILYKGSPIGVAQISRKGETPVEAGADFTPMDVKKAQDFFEAFAPYLYSARPDKF
jgi:hypothetical protein